MATTLNLNVAEYNDFLRCLMNLKEVCNDVEFRDGVIRQRSNDKTTVFEVDMTPITPGLTMALSDTKRKLEVLKTFTGQDVTIQVVDGDPGHFIFSDSFTAITFMAPSLQYLDNKFMTHEELENIFLMNEDDLILEHDLSSMITERIRLITHNFSTDAIQITFEGETASIKTATQAKDQLADVVTGITTNVVLDGCSALISTVPFSVDHDTDVEFKMFKDPNQDISLNQFSTNLGDINFKIFTRSSIVRDEE